MTCFLELRYKKKSYTTLKAILGLGVFSLLDKLTTSSIVLRPFNLESKLLSINTSKQTYLNLRSIEIINRLLS
jgi:hypothetical protein